MLSELCGYLRNFFEKEQYFGEFSILGGAIAPLGGGDLPLLEGQYIRIVGSVLNDGVYKWSEDGIEELTDETFKGSVWALAIPKEVINLSAEIDAWKAKYEGTDSQSMSPFASESFGGYSYTKASGGADASGGLGGWQGAFYNRLSQWRKI